MGKVSVMSKKNENCYKRWDFYFEELIRYKKKHGNCNVPQQRVGTTLLAKWVHKQRLLFSENRLSLEKFEALEKIGFYFCLRVSKTQWEDNFQLLLKQKEKKGTCNLNFNEENNVHLVAWTRLLRLQYILFQSGKTSFQILNDLSLERIQKLESIGFDWEYDPKKVKLNQFRFIHKRKECKANAIEYRTQRNKNTRSFENDINLEGSHKKTKKSATEKSEKHEHISTPIHNDYVLSWRCDICYKFFATKEEASDHEKNNCQGRLYTS